MLEATGEQNLRQTGHLVSVQV